jgi:hypothetical protein
VYAGEVYGIVMALEMIRDSGRICPAHIYSDNQAGITALNDPTTTTAQALHRTLHETLCSVICPVTIHWIPARTGIPGNEATDTAAKTATGWRLKDRGGDKAPEPPEHLRGIQMAPLINRLEQATLNRWKENWKAAKHGRSLRRLTTEPAKNNIRLYRGLSIPKGALIVQMKTGKIAPRKYLHSRRVPNVDDPYCDRCSMRAPQTVGHILLICPAFTELHPHMHQPKVFASLLALKAIPKGLSYSAPRLARARLARLAHHGCPKVCQSPRYHGAR